jgi:hypothetical protein
MQEHPLEVAMRILCVGERDGQMARARAMLASSFACTSAVFTSSAPTTSEWPP